MKSAPAFCPFKSNKMEQVESIIASREPKSASRKEAQNMNLSLFKTFQSSKGLEAILNKMCNPFILKQNSYYLELAQLVEILKVEGFWTKRGALSISSKSPELIKCFSNLFNDLSMSYSIDYTLKIKLPIDYLDIKSISLFENGSEKRFNFEKNVFKGKIDKIAFSTRSKSGIYLLKINDAEHYFQFSISGNQFLSSPGLYVYSTVRANNKSFVVFLESVLSEKSGTYDIRINDFLKESSPFIIVRVFASVIDCEGSIRYSGLTRNIRLRMYNDSYLMDWKNLLSRIGITSNFSSGRLTITNNQNFQKFSDLGFELVHKTKKQRFESILKGYTKRQILRGSSKVFYVGQLKLLNRKVSVLEFSKILGKSKRVVSHYLTLLERTGYISADKSSKKFLYYAES